MSNKQSSIEWFAKESWKLRVELEDGKISLGEYANKYYQLKEQAKAMHREESQKIFECGRNFQLTGEGTFKQVYNETFNTHENNNRI